MPAESFECIFRVYIPCVSVSFFLFLAALTPILHYHILIQWVFGCFFFFYSCSLVITAVVYEYMTCHTIILCLLIHLIKRLGRAISNIYLILQKWRFKLIIDVQIIVWDNILHMPCAVISKALQSYADWQLLGVDYKPNFAVECLRLHLNLSLAVSFTIVDSLRWKCHTGTELETIKSQLGRLKSNLMEHEWIIYICHL